MHEWHTNTHVRCWCATHAQITCVFMRISRVCVCANDAHTQARTHVLLQSTVRDMTRKLVLL